MENNTHTVDLIRLRTLFPMSSCLNMGNDVSLINVRYDESLSFMQYPCRFDGFMAFFCISGRIRVMINLAEFDVVENSFFVYLPGNIISIPEVAEAEKANLNFMVIAMTNEYVESLNIKPYKIIDKRIIGALETFDERLWRLLPETIQRLMKITGRQLGIAA